MAVIGPSRSIEAVRARLSRGVTWADCGLSDRAWRSARWRVGSQSGARDRRKDARARHLVVALYRLVPSSKSLKDHAPAGKGAVADGIELEGPIVGLERFFVSTAVGR
jgi:hypothetical protein